MSDEEFVAFCENYPDCLIECTAGGETLIIPPTDVKTGKRNAKLTARLATWAEMDQRGEVSDSSTGFRLPNGARRSPDASWTRNDRVQALTPEQQDGFYGICPDFVIELRSDSDRLAKVKNKMQEYMNNGARLGWLIDPLERKVWIYRPDRTRVSRQSVISGG
jgi:Uma2 family endonuclease